MKSKFFDSGGERRKMLTGVQRIVGGDPPDWISCPLSIEEEVVDHCLDDACTVEDVPRFVSSLFMGLLMGLVMDYYFDCRSLRLREASRFGDVICGAIWPPDELVRGYLTFILLVTTTFARLRM